MKLLLLTLFAFLFSVALFAQAPASYYTGTDNLSCSSLKTALKQIISTSVRPQSYGALWTQYIKSDIKPRTVGTGSANVIYDIYSTVPNGTDPYQFTPSTNQCGNVGPEGTCYNREHSVPLSWFSGSTSTNGTATDYNFIFPTDSKVNGQHANFPYAEVAAASWTSLTGNKLGSSAVAGITGQVFEPIDEYKGDIARAFLYFVTMYEDNLPTWSNNPDAAQAFGKTAFPGVNIPYLQMMLKWNDQDPVSQKEIDRNNAAYTFQSNRNPFIDSPQYVHRIWSNECPGLSTLPVNLVYFTGKQNGKNVLLQWQVNKEIGLASYIIEKSINGSDYIPLSEIKASGSYNYSYSDNIQYNAGNNVYYRLKKIDKNGVFNYSSVLKLAVPNDKRVTIYPNPAKNFIHLITENYYSKPIDVLLTNALGKTVLHQSFVSTDGQFDISTQNLANGNYYMRIITSDKTFSTSVVIAK